MFLKKTIQKYIKRNLIVKRGQIKGFYGYWYDRHLIIPLLIFFFICVSFFLLTESIYIEIWSTVVFICGFILFLYIEYRLEFGYKSEEKSEPSNEII